MKRITSIIIAVMIILTALSTVCLPTAFAANYCGENVTWSLTDGVLTISGSGDMTEYRHFSNTPWYRQKDTITEVVVENGVTSIGDYAFYLCNSIESVDLPDGLLKIGNYAFSRCPLLNQVSIPSGLTELENGAFSYCPSLESITIPSGVTRISDRVFEFCTSLTDIELHEGIIEIGERAFENTPFLENSLKEAEDAFYVNKILYKAKSTLTGKYTIKPDTIQICAAAFFGVEGVTEVVIPNTVTAIENSTFSGCISLEKIDIPSSIESIYDYAFNGCVALKSITVPETVTHVGDYAFNHCSSVTEYTTGQGGINGCIGIWFLNLKKITLLSDVTELYSEWRNDYGVEPVYLTDKFNAYTVLLKEITVVEENEHFCSENGILYSKDKKSIVVYPNNKAAKAFALPDEITSVEKTAFAYCENLTSLLLNRNVNSLNWEKFSKNIKNVYVRSSAKTNTAFENGKPSDVTVIYLEDKLTDISRDKWYADYVETAYGYQLFNGISDTKFEPNKTLTRAMFITVLARISGAELDNSAATDFKDVEKGKWYTGAIKWAVANGVTNGLDAKTFGVNNNITREQMCTMLVRFADCLEITLKSDIEAISFHDDKSISDWAKESVYTCQRAGIINGIETDGKTCFNPRGNATRAEASKITVLFYKDYI